MSKTECLNVVKFAVVKYLMDRKVYFDYGDMYEIQNYADEKQWQEAWEKLTFYEQLEQIEWIAKAYDNGDTPSSDFEYSYSRFIDIIKEDIFGEYIATMIHRLYYEVEKAYNKQGNENDYEDLVNEPIESADEMINLIRLITDVTIE